MQHAPLTTITVAVYLACEMTGQIKHEFVPGQVFAMSSVREQHNLITLNIATRLREKTRGGQCRVLVTDVKLRVEAADAFYYPDVMVCCDPADDDPYVKRSPITDHRRGGAVAKHGSHRQAGEFVCIPQLAAQ